MPKPISATTKREPSISQEERARRLAAAYRIILDAGRKAREDEKVANVTKADRPGTLATDQTLATKPETPKG